MAVANVPRDLAVGGWGVATREEEGGGLEADA